MHSYFWRWRMSINAARWTYLICFCVPSLWPPFILFPLSPFHLESTLLGIKDLLFLLLGFPRHASLEDRSPESSAPYVALDSRSSLIRTTLGVHTSSFPSSHLRVSRTPKFFKVTWIILSHRYAVLGDNICLFSPSKEIRWRAFFRSFHRNEFVRRILIRCRVPSFPCNINTIGFVFPSDVLAFLQSSSRIVSFFSK